jgi:hypothetical protein
MRHYRSGCDILAAMSGRNAGEWRSDPGAGEIAARPSDHRRTATDFRDFTFANVVRLFGAGNPRFFEGTRVAREVAQVLRAAPARRLRNRAPAEIRRRNCLMTATGF